MGYGRETYSDAKQGAKGPSWTEVLRYWSELNATYVHELAIGITVVKSGDGKPGMRGAIGCACTVQPYASFSFGPAYQNSPATLPAAFWLMLVEADEVLHDKALWELERVAGHRPPGDADDE